MIAKLSKSSPENVKGFRTGFKGGVAVASLSKAVKVTRTLHHGFGYR